MPTIRERVIAEIGRQGWADHELCDFWIVNGTLEDMLEMPEEELNAMWAKWKLEKDNEQ